MSRLIHRIVIPGTDDCRPLVCQGAKDGASADDLFGQANPALRVQNVTTEDNQIISVGRSYQPGQPLRIEAEVSGEKCAHGLRFKRAAKKPQPFAFVGILREGKTSDHGRGRPCHHVEGTKTRQSCIPLGGTLNKQRRAFSLSGEPSNISRQNRVTNFYFEAVMQFLVPNELKAGFWAIEAQHLAPELIDFGQGWAHSGWTLNPHLHRHWEFYLQIEGETEWAAMGQKAVTLSSGSLYCVAPNINHWMFRSSDSNRYSGTLDFGTSGT